MRAAGYILNTEGRGIPGASLRIVDEETLQPTGSGTATNASGYFSFDFPDMFSPWFLEVTSIGYKGIYIFPSHVNTNMRFALQYKQNELPPVVITTPAKKQFPVWALLPLLLLAQKKKRVAGINSNQVLMIGGGVIAFSVLSSILQKFGIWDTKEEKDRQTAYDNSAGEVLSTQTPTKPDWEWKTIADLIYEDLRYSSIDDKTEDAGYQIARVQNDADIITLARLFGIRTETFFGIPVGNFNFYQFIRRNLSRTKLDTINGNYASKRIKFRW